MNLHADEQRKETLEDGGRLSVHCLRDKGMPVSWVSATTQGHYLTCDDDFCRGLTLGIYLPTYFKSICLYTLGFKPVEIGIKSY